MQEILLCIIKPPKIEFPETERNVQASIFIETPWSFVFDTLFDKEYQWKIFYIEFVFSFIFQAAYYIYII